MPLSISIFFIIINIFLLQNVSASVHFPPSRGQIEYTSLKQHDGSKLVDRIRRDTTEDSFRIFVHFDISVKKLMKSEQALIEQAVENATNFWKKAIRPKYRLKDRIRLTRQCTSKKIYIIGSNHSVHYCSEKCARETFCGDVTVPKDHLQQCHVCTKHDSCETIGEEGPGVDADFVLYISAKDTHRCRPSDTLATASFCQLESEHDRPIAGNVNVCPRRFSGVHHSIDFDQFVSTIKHEILHTLVFSSGLFAFFRDENDQPLTERDPSTRWPTKYDDHLQVYVPSQRILRNLIRKNWSVRGGTMEKTIAMIVTPRVQKVVRDHFKCLQLEGAELEDQGDVGTALTHWEKRLFEHEIMTGTYTQESVISNLTLALLEDSGWYHVFYEYGKPLLWGRALGCDFVMSSCKQWIDTRLSKRENPYPFCASSSKLMESKRKCANTYDKIVICNLIEYTQPLPAEYQIFDTLGNVSDDEELSRLGGHVVLANYCPYEQELSYHKSHRNSRCYRHDNQPPNHENFALENYSPRSRCFDHGSVWEQYIDRCTRRRMIFPQTAGCYQYDCVPSKGISIRLGEKSYLCAYEGQNISFIIAQNDSVYFGSVLCPDCKLFCASIPNFQCPRNQRRASVSFDFFSNDKETNGQICARVSNTVFSDKNQSERNCSPSFFLLSWFLYLTFFFSVK